MGQRSPPSSRLAPPLSSAQLRDVQKTLQESFSVLVLQCGSFCREMKQTLSDKLKISVTSGWSTDHIQSPTIQQFKDVTILINQDLKSILSLTKILLSGKTQLTGLDSNQYRILKSCVALNQLTSTLDQFFLSTEVESEFKGEVMNLMKSLSDNVYSYQSTNEEFNDVIKQLVTRSPSINLSLPMGNLKQSRESERNLSMTSAVTNNGKDNESLRRIIAEKQMEFQKNNEEFSICIEEYNRYIYQLKDEISNLSQQLIMIEKDREELKQHNIILLKNTGVLPQNQKVSNSRISMRNTNRRLTVTEFDQRGSMRRSQAPSYRASHLHNNSETSFLSMTRLINDKK